MCAFVVGINEYDDLPPLKRGVGDSLAVQKELHKVGVERITSATDCTYDQLKDKTNEYLSKLQKGDVALVYIAAHAAMYQNQNVVLTKTSNKKNLADTSLRVQLLLTRSTIWRAVDTSANQILGLTPPTHF